MQPPFEFRVTDVITAQNLIKNQWPTKIITLLGKEYPAGMPSQGAHHLTVQLDDITYSAPGCNTPSTFHVDNILKFSKGFVASDRVLFHCFAGVSRSTATAVGVLCQHEIPPAQAIGLVEQRASDLDPNELMLFHFDSLLGLKLSLMDSYRTWSRTQNGRLVNLMPRNFSAELDRNAREYYNQISQRVSLKNMDLL